MIFYQKGKYTIITGVALCYLLFVQQKLCLDIFKFTVDTNCLRIDLNLGLPHVTLTYIDSLQSTNSQVDALDHNQLI